MTKEELQAIIQESSKEIIDSLDRDKITALYTNGNEHPTMADLFVGGALSAIKMNQDLLFKVLSKALCKDCEKS